MSRPTTAEKAAEVVRHLGGRDDLRRLEARMRGEEKQDWPVMQATSLVNYASAPIGGKKFDASSFPK
jgi:hypothetical protein